MCAVKVSVDGIYISPVADSTPRACATPMTTESTHQPSRQGEIHIPHPPRHSCIVNVAGGLLACVWCPTSFVCVGERGCSSVAFLTVAPWDWSVHRKQGPRGERRERGKKRQSKASETCTCSCRMHICGSRFVRLFDFVQHT